MSATARVVVDPGKRQDEPGSVRVEHEPTAERPKRISQSEVLRAFLDRMAANAGAEHSTVTLKSNAKGDTQIEVSVRTGDSPEVATVDDAASKCKAVYDTLRAFYPPSPPEVTK